MATVRAALLGLLCAAAAAPSAAADCEDSTSWFYKKTS
jgi:hypothetical protein